MSRIKIEFKTTDGANGYDKSAVCRDVNLTHEEIEEEAEKFINKLERLSRRNR